MPPSYPRPEAFSRRATPEVIGIIKTFSHKRKQVVGDETEFDFTLFKSVPVEVTVGGAAIFVLDVENFIKC